MFSDPLGPYGPLLWPPLLLAFAAVARLLLPQRLHLQWLVGTWAQALRHKTLHSNRPAGQQRLAGLLALLLVLLPLLVMASLALLHPALELLLLTLLLPLAQLPGKALAEALQRADKTAALKLLSPFAMRDLTPLSLMGLTKAAIELQLERRSSQFFAVSFWYLLGGMPLAMLAWSAAELARHWHIEKPPMAAFGAPTWQLSSLLQWPVQLLLGFTLSLYGSPAQAWQWRHQLSQHWQWRYQQWSQLCLASSLGIQLSGPWLLEGHKALRPRLGPEIAPQPAQLVRAVNMLNLAQGLWLLIPMLLAVTISWLSHQ
ncbi:cobalamin biosynthesis protein [Ferrimonas senticii]|uniref:cobalamin biosynthesis protein n=1 Tax=Ferrimonas senticii TaxID=394566 RepID=UPI0004143183|nr:cobalamin biosynthesis protein [Ferrimonas senticii]